VVGEADWAKVDAGVLAGFGTRGIVATFMLAVLLL
jgi:hypothetical protein